MMGLFIPHRPFPTWSHPAAFFARASCPSSCKHSLRPVSNASSQLCKAQGKRFHPDRSRQSPDALKHEVWLPLSQFIIKSKTVAMNTGPGLHLWNDICQSAEVREGPFSLLISAYREDPLQTTGKKKSLQLWADFMTLSTLSWAGRVASGSHVFSLSCGQEVCNLLPRGLPTLVLTSSTLLGWESECYKMLGKLQVLWGLRNSGYTRASCLHLRSSYHRYESLEECAENANTGASCQTQQHRPTDAGALGICV